MSINHTYYDVFIGYRYSELAERRIAVPGKSNGGF